MAEGRRFSIWRIAAWSLPAFAMAGFLYVAVRGSAVVRDETGAVASAVITDDRIEQPLHRLPGGLFFAVPGMEGIIEVRCSNGAKARAGYVAAYTHSRVRAIGPAPCARLVED